MPKLKIFRDVQHKVGAAKLFEKERAQWVMRMTEDGRILDEQLPVMKGFFESDPTQECWILDAPNQVPDSLEEKGSRMLQVVSERDCQPYPLWQPPVKKFGEAEVDKIAEMGTDEAMLEAAKAAARSRMFWLMMVSIGVLALIVILAMLGESCKGLMSGGVKLPW